MPRNDGGTGGDGQGPHGPWSRGPSGGGAPDLEELLRRGQERLRQLLVPGIKFTRAHAIGIALVAVACWLLSGVYFVASHEQGFVMRFGKVVAHSNQGMNYRLPWPIETDKVVEVMGGNQLSIGTQAGSADASDITQQRIDYPAESLMLTGDGDIVDVNFTVMWSVKDASAYLFNVDGTDKTIKAVAESAMREVIGQSAFDAINPNREAIERRVRGMIQKTLDDYGAGIAVTSVQLGTASAPEQVGRADRDVQAAQTAQMEKRGDAETYANKVIPEARGDAARLIQEAEAYRQQAIAEAGGEAKQFLAVYEQYKKAPDVTRRRMYLETMSKVLAPMNKVILDGAAGRNVVPYLPLPELQRNKSETLTMTPPLAGANPSRASSGARP
ncbi:MAG TPA: FtsH protease activity modulator HflK [Rhizomicrobium sp.]|nr:FtsH protease activity modulator HflK [Rhizomicrobium sp.]